MALAALVRLRCAFGGTLIAVSLSHSPVVVCLPAARRRFAAGRAATLCAAAFVRGILLLRGFAGPSDLACPLPLALPLLLPTTTILWDARCRLVGFAEAAAGAVVSMVTLQSIRIRSDSAATAYAPATAAVFWCDMRLSPCRDDDIAGAGASAGAGGPVQTIAPATIAAAQPLAQAPKPTAADDAQEEARRQREAAEADLKRQQQQEGMRLQALQQR